MKLSNIDRLFYGILTVLLGFSIYYGFAKPDYFDKGFAQEDGFVEYATAFMLLATSLLCLYRVVANGSKKILWIVGTLGFAILFFFGAGEEVSWGQRIFDIESNEFFLENNAQQETNLHNLVVADKKINKIIFSQLLMLVMVTYLLVVPWLYRKKKWASELLNKFAVPVVDWHHSLAFIGATIIIAILPSSRKWEVYELVFGLLFLLIFLRPFNSEIFNRK